MTRPHGTTPASRAREIYAHPNGTTLVLDHQGRTVFELSGKGERTLRSALVSAPVGTRIHGLTLFQIHKLVPGLTVGRVPGFHHLFVKGVATGVLELFYMAAAAEEDGQDDARLELALEEER